MQHNAAFHQGLHCLLIHVLKESSETEIYHYLENSTCGPLLKYTMGSPILNVSIHMGKAIRIHLEFCSEVADLCLHCFQRMHLGLGRQGKRLKTGLTFFHLGMESKWSRKFGLGKTIIMQG